MNFALAPLVRDATSEDRDDLRKQFQSAVPFLNNCALVATLDGEVVAFLTWLRVSPDECEILQMETAEPFRRRGIARALLRELKTRERASVFLEVRKSNQGALQLYYSEGFREVGLRREYYSCPTEDGIVLQFLP